MFRTGKQFLGIVLVCLSLFTQIGCKDDVKEDLVGNWYRSGVPDFRGIARSAAVAFVLGDSAYVGTGYSNQLNSLKDFYKFNVTYNSWTQIADFGGEIRNDAVAFAIAGKGYVGTGYNSNAERYTKDFWQYDPTKNSWKKISEFPGDARQHASAFSIGDKAYVGMGFDGNNYLQDFYEYTAATDSWKIVAGFSNKRRGAVTFSIGSKGYLAFGLNNSQKYRGDIWEFDPTQNGGIGTWTQKTMLKVDDAEQGRAFSVPLVLNNKAYLVGGTTGGSLSTVWEYDPATDAWTEKTAFEGGARNFAVGFVLKGVGYYGTGIAGTRLDDMWGFNPSAAQDSDDNY